MGGVGKGFGGGPVSTIQWPIVFEVHWSFVSFICVFLSCFCKLFEVLAPSKNRGVCVLFQRNKPCEASATAHTEGFGGFRHQIPENPKIPKHIFRDDDLKIKIPDKLRDETSYRPDQSCPPSSLVSPKRVVGCRGGNRYFEGDSKIYHNVSSSQRFKKLIF